jgi:phenylalanyl-tRNA synthetase beta chain
MCTKEQSSGGKIICFEFHNPDSAKTLTDVQIDKIMNKLQTNFETELGAVLR